MADIKGISEETLEAVKKAQTDGITHATGITGYDLSGLISLVPVETPFYDLIPRNAGTGSEAAHWQAMLNVNASQPNPFVGIENAGTLVKFAKRDVLAKYKPVRVSGQVTRDEVDFAAGYADAKALAVTGTMMQWRLQENKALIAGQAFALAAIGDVTLAEGTGGSIAATTAVHVKAQARSGYNYYWGGSGKASDDATVTTTGADASVTATVKAVSGAVAYDWFVGSSGSNQKYVTTTTANKLVITALPTAAGSVPAIPSLSSTVPTIASADGSSSDNSYNGLLASLFGDYGTAGLVTPGSGEASGATVTSLDGAALATSSQGIKAIDDFLLDLFVAANLSPTRFIMSGRTATNIGDLVLGTSAAVTYLEPQGNGRQGVTAGGSVARYINKAAGGQSVDITVDPHFPNGMIVAMTDRVTYPNSGISNVFEARTLRDVSEFDYGNTISDGGPRETWDVSSIETFVNRAPVACGVLSNIGDPTD